MTDSLFQCADQQAAEIARELKEGEFYGLANDRIKWLLDERKRLRTQGDNLRDELRRHEAFRTDLSDV